MGSLPGCVKRVLLSEPLWWLFPTPCTYYLNRERVREPEKLPPDLPTMDWALRERHALLSSSEDRMRGLEGKGPGLATVNAIVAAAVVVAISVDWSKTVVVGRVLIVGAAVYSAFSLVMPIYLVGPLKRSTIHTPELSEAGQSETPEVALAELAAIAAMENNLRNLRLGNLLDAARRELGYALVLLLIWALLVPVTGLLARQAHVQRSGAAERQPAACLAGRDRPASTSASKSAVMLRTHNESCQSSRRRRMMDQ